MDHANKQTAQDAAQDALRASADARSAASDAIRIEEYESAFRLLERSEEEIRKAKEAVSFLRCHDRPKGK